MVSTVTPLSVLASVEDLLEDLRAGRCIVLIDDEDRENEGDLVCAAEFATAANINFMAREARGLICLALTEEQCRRLDLTPMVSHNTAQFGTAFTVSIDALEGCTTGISAADRSRTILTAIRKDVRPAELARPGHVFPLSARPGGVLARPGQTEGSVDLCRLAGLRPAGVICEIMNDDGSMARLAELEEFARHHVLKIGSIAQLIDYRLARDSLVSLEVSTQVPTRYGPFDLHVYRSQIDGARHVVLSRGDRLHPGAEACEDPILIRVHRETDPGELMTLFDSSASRWLEQAVECVHQQGEGLILYLCPSVPHDPLHRLATLTANKDLEKLRPPVAVSSMREDVRAIGLGCQILRDMGARRLRLMTDSERDYSEVRDYGLEIVDKIPFRKV